VIWASSLFWLPEMVSVTTKSMGLSVDRPTYMNQTHSWFNWKIPHCCDLFPKNGCPESLQHSPLCSEDQNLIKKFHLCSFSFLTQGDILGTNHQIYPPYYIPECMTPWLLTTGTRLFSRSLELTHLA
jgi:hypothetical protein